jgi:pentatricopeptide repeat protein
MAVMDFISWNAMIAGHFQNGDCNTGWSCFLLCCTMRFSLTSGSFGMEVVVKLGTITAGQSGKLVNFGMD